MLFSDGGIGFIPPTFYYWYTPQHNQLAVGSTVTTSTNNNNDMEITPTQLPQPEPQQQPQSQSQEAPDKQFDVSIFINGCKAGDEFTVRSCVHYMNEHHIPIDQEDHEGFTPLYYACKAGNPTVITFLWRHGADLFKTNERMVTSPIAMAIKRGVGDQLYNYFAKKVESMAPSQDHR